MATGGTGLGGGQATRGFVTEWRFRDLMCQSPTGGFLFRLLGGVEVLSQRGKKGPGCLGAVSWLARLVFHAENEDCVA